MVRRRSGLAGARQELQRLSYRFRLPQAIQLMPAKYAFRWRRGAHKSEYAVSQALNILHR